jgi:hypothetical protein
MNEEEWMDSVIDVSKSVPDATNSFVRSDRVVNKGRKRSAASDIPKRVSKETREIIEAYVLQSNEISQKSLNYVSDLNQLAEIYSVLKEMRLEHHDMVKECVDRVWALRKQWLVSAYVPERDEEERNAWIYAAINHR